MKGGGGETGCGGCVDVAVCSGCFSGFLFSLCHRNWELFCLVVFLLGCVGCVRVYGWRTLRSL